MVEEIQYILRGYEDFDEKLRALGADMVFARSEDEAGKFFLRTRRIG